MNHCSGGALEVCSGVVKPEWIDINGHMNVAYYTLAFDLAVDMLWSELGITEEYIETTGGSTFAVESHLIYRRELKEAEPYRITVEIIAYDEKRVHQFQCMYHADQNYLVATAEWMNLHVNLQTRRVSRWPDSVLSAFAKLAQGQDDAIVPRDVGKRMSINNPVYAMPAERG